MNDCLLPLTSALLAETTQPPAHNSANQSNALVIRMLADEFRVNEVLINALYPHGPDYTEIRRVLSISEQMPGGINHGNIRKVMDMRREGGHKKAWIEIVRELGVALDHRTLRSGELAGGKI